MNPSDLWLLMVWSILPGSNSIVHASSGDRSPVFQHYFLKCLKANCSHSNKIKAFNVKQPFYLRYLGWDCKSECQLEAQWRTLKQSTFVKQFKIPQFFGKWTFYRLLGIQEPASFLFSICNLLTNLYGWNKYKIAAKHDPYYNLWKFQTIIAINAWFWSIVYHARDTAMTEKLDYFSAYLIVIYSLYTITIKLLVEVFGFNYETIRTLVIIPFVAFYLYHINYLLNVRFDYGYNMKVNVITGFASTIFWFIWCFRNRHGRPHIRKCLLSLVYVNICLALELFDFAPFFYIFDAHSIWHLATSLFPLFWYSFLKDEAIYLVKNSSEGQKKMK